MFLFVWDLQYCNQRGVETIRIKQKVCRMLIFLCFWKRILFSEPNVLKKPDWTPLHNFLTMFGKKSAFSKKLQRIIKIKEWGPVFQTDRFFQSCVSLDVKHWTESWVELSAYERRFFGSLNSLSSATPELSKAESPWLSSSKELSWEQHYCC